MVPRREERGLPNAMAMAASAPAELGCGDGAVGLGKPGAAGRAGSAVSHAGLVCESVGRWGVGHADEGQGGAFEARRGGMAGVGPKRGSPAIAAGSAIGSSAGRCTNAAARLWSSTAAVAEGGTGARTSATKRCSQWVREGMVGWLCKRTKWKVPTTGEACHIRRELLGSAAAWASGLSFLIITPENSGGKGRRRASGKEIPICRADHCRAAWGMIRRETSCVPLLWSRPPQSPPRSLATPGEDLQVLQTCSGPCRLLFCRAELRLDRGLDDELPPTASRPTTHAPRPAPHGPRPTADAHSPFAIPGRTSLPAEPCLKGMPLVTRVGPGSSKRPLIP